MKLLTCTDALKIHRVNSFLLTAIDSQTYFHPWYTHAHTYTHALTDVCTTPSGPRDGSSGISGLIDGSCLLVISPCQTSVT